MAEGILVMGRSGMGKSRSMKNLDPATTVVIRVLKKPLPFKGWKKGYKPYNKETKEGNVFDLSKAETVKSCLDFISMSMPHIKTIVVDDAGTIMSLELFDKATETGYGKFTVCAKNMKEILMKPAGMREDLFVVFMFHVEMASFNGYDTMKAKTSGKMLDSQLGVESLFTYVLLTDILVKGKDEKRHVFITQSDGSTTVKTPEDMFPDKHIENDLKYVIECIIKYNEED